jgi:hypothetical protein
LESSGVALGLLRRNLSRKLGFEHGRNGQLGCPWWADRWVYRMAYLQGMGPGPETPKRRDYYALIARAVAALNDNSRIARQALYNRARAAQTAQLNNAEPALSVAEITCECEALEHAIRALELEAATGGARLTMRPSVVVAPQVRRSDVKPHGDGLVRRRTIDDVVPPERDSVIPIREHLRHRQRR